MYERELHIAYRTALMMEELLTEDITGAHELYFDHVVDDGGNPYVAVSVSGRDGVAKLSKLFGDAVQFHGRDGHPVKVAVIVKDHQPQARLN